MPLDQLLHCVSELIKPDASPRVEEAIEHVKRGAAIAPAQEKPFLFLGRLYKVLGNVKAAERMFTRAVQIQPERMEALRELRLINLRRGKTEVCWADCCAGSRANLLVSAVARGQFGQAREP